MRRLIITGIFLLFSGSVFAETIGAVKGKYQWFRDLDYVVSEPSMYTAVQGSLNLSDQVYVSLDIYVDEELKEAKRYAGYLGIKDWMLYVEDGEANYELDISDPLLDYTTRGKFSNTFQAVGIQNRNFNIEVVPGFLTFSGLLYIKTQLPAQSEATNSTDYKTKDFVDPMADLEILGFYQTINDHFLDNIQRVYEKGGKITDASYSLYGTVGYARAKNSDYHAKSATAKYAEGIAYYMEGLWHMDFIRSLGSKTVMGLSLGVNATMLSFLSYTDAEAGMNEKMPGSMMYFYYGPYASFALVW